MRRKNSLIEACNFIFFFAALYFCFRDDLNKIETVSQTEIKCVWSQQKSSTREKYKPVPICEMPCFADFKPTCHSTDVNKLLLLYKEELPEAAFVKHIIGRKRVFGETADDSHSSQPSTSSGLQHELEPLQNIVAKAPLMQFLAKFLVPLKKCCHCKLLEIFKEEDVANCIYVSQHSQSWLKARKFRMTGSRCYEIYTYKNNNNWIKKSHSFFFSTPLKNKYISHGLKFEDHAKKAFILQTGVDVRDFGLIIPPTNLWLGYSPDGVIFENNTPIALLEIKCLYAGATSTIEDALSSCNYLCEGNGGLQLKKKHKYYGQINLGMSILNLPKCYFVIYASYDDSLKIIEVAHDYEFSKILLTTIKTKFFQNMIHNLCER